VQNLQSTNVKNMHPSVQNISHCHQFLRAAWKANNQDVNEKT